MQAILKIYSRYVNKSSDSVNDKSFFYNYFMVPFSAGLAGFASFLFILLLLETGAFILGITKVLSFGINEVLIATLGFILQFTYRLIKSIQESQVNKV